MLTPMARQNLIVEDLETETVIYDQAGNEAHCLDATAAFVWRRCDGERTIEQLRTELTQEIGQTVSKSELLGLIEMIEAKGLTEDSNSTGQVDSFSRRGVLRKAVVIGTLCVTIQSIVAPTPAHAASCGTGGRNPPRRPPVPRPKSHSHPHKNSPSHPRRKSPSHPHKNGLLHSIVKQLHKLLH